MVVSILIFTMTCTCTLPFWVLVILMLFQPEVVISTSLSFVVLLMLSAVPKDVPPSFDTARVMSEVEVPSIIPRDI